MEETEGASAAWFSAEIADENIIVDACWFRGGWWDPNTISWKNIEEGKMPDNVLIFGKDAWPYTRAARAAFAKDGRKVDYYNVVTEVGYLETMLKYSNGTRKVPIIVEGETVTIGFEGDTWGIWFFRL